MTAHSILKIKFCFTGLKMEYTVSLVSIKKVQAKFTGKLLDLFRIAFTSKTRNSSSDAKKCSSTFWEQRECISSSGCFPSRAKQFPRAHIEDFHPRAPHSVS
ncbi:hypothetical protein ACOME3_008430 [Neoechinorhynchus agilis]